MRSTFWLNCICERQSCQNRHTGLKSSSKREKSALFMKIVQNARFRSCAGGFAQIVFFEGQTSQTSLDLSQILFKTGKQCAFHENCTTRSFQVMRSTFLAKSHFKASKLSKSSHWPGILSKTGKQCAFHKNCTKRAFQVMRSTFWPKRIFKRQSCQNRHTGLKFSPKRENSALFMKIVQNALFRSCAARFGQIAFLSVKVVKIVTLASNSLQNGENVRVSWKLYKTLVSGHAQHVLAKSHFWASKSSKSSHWPEILSKKGKQCAFHENCTKRSFQVMRSRFWPNHIFQRHSCPNRHAGLKFFSETGKQCAFHENCTKRSFRVIRRTFWPNRIFERQSCPNRQTGLKFSLKQGKSALFMKIVQNACFRCYAGTFWPNRILERQKLSKSSYWA